MVLQMADEVIMNPYLSVGQFQNMRLEGIHVRIGQGGSLEHHVHFSYLYVIVVIERGTFGLRGVKGFGPLALEENAVGDDHLRASKIR